MSSSNYGKVKDSKGNTWEVVKMTTHYVHLEEATAKRKPNVVTVKNFVNTFKVLES